MAAAVAPPTPPPVPPGAPDTAFGDIAPPPGSPVSMSKQWRMPSKAELEQAAEVLRDDPSEVGRCIACCTLLESATQRSSASHKKVLEAGAPKCFVIAMAAHLGNAEVQALSLRAMQHLSSSVYLHGPRLVAEVGGCAAAVAAMQAHQGNAAVQQVACHTLELVAFGGAGPRARALQDGAIEATVRALKAHKDRSPVVQAAFAALQVLAEDGDEAVRRFADAGGVSAMVSALQELKEDAQAHYWGNILVRSLSAVNPDVRTDVQRKCHWKGIELDIDD